MHDLLRLTTCGSVDDGKSTLIGRLLFDTKNIFEDQWAAVQNFSRKRGDEHVDLALLTDGLRAEREQGITIDVAYRYFSTPQRKFIIADCPGHLQYTRNMVTGASTANLALVLVDARKGILEQTRRHSFIASLLGIKHIILCINKMDLVGFSEETYQRIVAEYQDFSSRLEIPDIRFLPLSALEGDNVVTPSTRMPWYTGGSLLQQLENLYIGGDANHIDARFPVQLVVRPQSKEHPDYRGFSGRVASGVFKVGDEVVHLPSGFSSRITRIDTPQGPVNEAFHPMSATLCLADNLDISRGDTLAKANNQPAPRQDLEVVACWFSGRRLQTGQAYTLKHGPRHVRAMATEQRYRIDINTLHKVEGSETLGMNDIGRLVLRTTAPLYADPYRQNRQTGSLILIDESTNETVAACMVI